MAASQFDKLGHPGKYTKSIKFVGGQLDLTGSNYGYGSIIIKTAGSATASLSDGGYVTLSDLSAGVVYDLSLAQLSGSLQTATIAYVFSRQQ